MNVLVVGSGAREHALAWKLRQSARLGDLFVAPGNAGTAAVAQNLDLKAADLDGICRAAAEKSVDLVIVGPEDPLARGLVDRLSVLGVSAFGPSRDAARIEASKSFAKEIMRANGIPTADSATFTTRVEAESYVESLSGPIVVK